MTKIACLKCNSKKLYKMSDGKRRCAQCQYEFIPHKLPLTFSREEWRVIIHLFLMEQSSCSIAEQTGFDKQRVMRALTRIRLVNHGDRQYSDGKGNHINGLEGFWGYLKRKLSSKGGIRRVKLPLYLGEYVWRYNHRSDPERIKIRRIIQLLEKS
jgi:hypothetical protein